MSQPVRSPCVSICALDENDLCVGCYRTGQEITVWGSLSDDEKRDVMKKVAEREQSAANFIPVP
ncbi:DUF1289 domain-containing protein [Thalassolituus sp. LLYu03]|uniref:DUF1289 domain-containing protein n=1 Tax=Thalassolituus sp. LLYu03 TaxID=3421656 RepID=UPI003D2E4F6F